MHAAISHSVSKISIPKCVRHLFWPIVKAGGHELWGPIKYNIMKIDERSIFTRTHSFQISLPFVSVCLFLGTNGQNPRFHYNWFCRPTWLDLILERTQKGSDILNWWILQKHENNSFHPFSLQFYFATPFSYGSISQLWNQVILVHSYVTISWVSSSHVRGSLAFQKD